MACSSSMARKSVEFLAWPSAKLETALKLFSITVTATGACSGLPRMIPLPPQENARNASIPDQPPVGSKRILRRRMPLVFWIRFGPTSDAAFVARGQTKLSLQPSREKRTPGYAASASRNFTQNSNDRQVSRIREHLLFDAIGEDAQRKSLGRRDGFFFCGPICQYTRHVYNLGNPAPVGLEFCFDFIHKCETRPYSNTPLLLRRESLVPLPRYHPPHLKLS